MLARIMIRDSSLQTYADVLIKAFGPRAKTGIYAMCQSPYPRLRNSVLFS